MLPCQEQNKSFFDQLQNVEGLDLRDTRGLRHELRVVLLGITLAILSNRDGNLSSIHCYMVNHHKRILESINYSFSPPISRSQLPNVLGMICLKVFESILFANFGVVLSVEERQWFALDGKELKGSIEMGNKRGDAIVQAVTHKDRVIQGQDFYSGIKESEISTVRAILKDNHLEGQKISMDALHCNPTTLQGINESAGIYLVGLKDNQKELLTECIEVVRFTKPTFTFTQKETIKPKHGRSEIRDYSVYNISQENKAERWQGSQINTLIKVEREIIEIKTQKKSTEISYHISNQKDCYIELCHAIRGHWSVEVVNHIRDVTFSEDDLTSKKKTYLVQWLV